MTVGKWGLVDSSNEIGRDIYICVEHIEVVKTLETWHWRSAYSDNYIINMQRDKR